jgi:ketosteroid isomerase-like protein
MNEPGADLMAMLTEYAAAARAKAPGRLAALYTADVRVFDAWDVWSLEGQPDWSRNLQDWLGSLGDQGVQVAFDEVRVADHGNAGSVSAIVTYSAVDASGQIAHAMQNRLSWFLTKMADGWVIAHEHTSAPIAFADQKAILRRR